MRELALVAVFYGLYTLVRDIHGENPTSPEIALRNALAVIRLERSAGVFHEAAIQHYFLADRSFMRFWDGFYGTAHFLAVIAVLVVLFARFPVHYRFWRNTLAFTTLLALIGFAVFPLMPPRMLPASYHFTDTLRTIGGLWDFQSGAVDEVSNQFAAMPSLHTAWSAWTALALMPLVRVRWGRAALLAYPAATVFCIVITANHYFADALGGVLTLGAGYWLASLWRDHGDRVKARVLDLAAGRAGSIRPEGRDPLLTGSIWADRLRTVPGEQAPGRPAAPDLRVVQPTRGRVGGGCGAPPRRGSIGLACL